MKILATVLLAAALAATACGNNENAAQPQNPAPSATSPTAPATANAALEAKSGSQMTGTAKFVENAGQVTVTVEVKGGTPGEHGVHLHEKPDCSAPDAKSAGGHFNPENAQHGAPGAGMHHAGDLGNFTVKDDGTGTLTLTTKDLTVAAGPHSVVGRSIVIHEKADDLSSQPSGNSGARVACGVISGS